MKINKVISAIAIYLTFFLLTSLVLLAVWYFFIDGTLYYCSDKAPLLDFIPPFVHVGGPYGDYFIVSPVVVYLSWAVFIATMLLIPTFLTKKFFQEKHQVKSSEVLT